MKRIFARHEAPCSSTGYFQGEKGVFPRIRNSSASADQALKTTETESLTKSRGYP